MSAEFPKNILNRSDNSTKRADSYSGMIKQFTGEDSAVGWDRKRSEVDQIMEKPVVWGGVFLVIALGFGLLLGGNFASGIFFMAIGGGPAIYIVINLRRARSIEDRVITHFLDIDRMRESAKNAVRMAFPQLEISHAAFETQTSIREMELALESAYADAFIKISQSQGSAWASMTKDQQAHELAKLDKEVLLEQAKGRVRVDELRAQGELNLSEIEKRHDLDLRKIKEDLFAEQERFEREMTKLDKTNSQAAVMQRLTEVTQLRKTLVASHAELRNNPALQDQLMAVIDEVRILEKTLQKMEPMSTEDYQRQEMIDQMLTRLLLKRHDIGDESKTVA